jgi:hypothetical protein
MFSMARVFSNIICECFCCILGAHLCTGMLLHLQSTSTLATACPNLLQTEILFCSLIC